jgi:hypothetical protein
MRRLGLASACVSTLSKWGFDDGLLSISWSGWDMVGSALKTL